MGLRGWAGSPLWPGWVWLVSVGLLHVSVVSWWAGQLVYGRLNYFLVVGQMLAGTHWFCLWPPSSKRAWACTHDGLRLLGAARKTHPSIEGPSKYLLVSCLLLTQQPKQIAWQRPESVWEGTIQRQACWQAIVTAASASEPPQLLIKT